MPKALQFMLYALFFLSGIVVASALGDNFQFSRILFLNIFCWILVVLFANVLLRNGVLILVTVSVLFFLLGVFYLADFERKTSATWAYGTETTILARVVSKPQRDEGLQKIIVSVDNIENGLSEGYRGRMLLVSLPGKHDIQYGDDLSLRGQISKPEKYSDFDYGRYLKKYPVYGTMERPAVLGAHRARGLKQRVWRGLYRIIDRMDYVLNFSLPEPHSSLASGILLGQKRSIPQVFRDDLAKTGLTHIVALSGFNVTIIVVALSELLLLWFGRKIVFLASGAVVLLFVVMTGAAPSIVRAAIFSLLIVFGRNIGRQPHQANLTLLAAVSMLLVNPFLLFYDIGFQLSFLAFTGLVYVSPVIKTFFERGRLKRIPQFISAPLADTLGAQVAVLPIIAYNFGQISLIAPVANIAVLWVVPISMLFIALIIFFGLIWKPLGITFALLAYAPITYILKTVQLFSKVPFAAVEIGGGSIVIFGMIVLALFVIVLYMLKRSNFRTHLQKR
ncbi:MAG: ComEC/Rec2 family competence protein [Patescibacteria group bacterium]